MLSVFYILPFRILRQGGSGVEVKASHGFSPTLGRATSCRDLDRALYVYSVFEF